ncbi:hypothetical protein KR018_002628, partial [Drosophila ironensis]
VSTSAGSGAGEEAKATRSLEEDNNSLEPGEVVTPPHEPAHQPQQPHPQQAKQPPGREALGKGLRKENGEADDSEGLYSDTDSSGPENPKAELEVEDVQLARKEKQAEAAAAALPPAPPAPAFMGLNPLRFHMRAPCFDFPRMGFMPRMARGGPRGMRPPFFGRPIAPNRMMSPLDPSACPQAPSPCKRPQSGQLWTRLQPPVSYVYNLLTECTNGKHKDCRQRVEAAAERPQEPGSDARKRLQDKEEQAPRSKTRERSGERGKTREKSKQRERERGKTRERSKNREKTKDTSPRAKTRERSNEKKQSKGRFRDKSAERNHVRGDTRQRSSEKEKSRAKTREKSVEKGRTKSREKSKERYLNGGKSKESSREGGPVPAKSSIPTNSHGDRPKAKNEPPRNTKERSHERNGHRSIKRGSSKEKDKSVSNTGGATSRESSRGRDGHRARPKDRPRSKPRDKPGEKQRDKSKDKDRTKSSEKPKTPAASADKRERSKERPREKSRDKGKLKSSREELREKAMDNSSEGRTESKHHPHTARGRSKERARDKERSREKSAKKTSGSKSREGSIEKHSKSKRSEGERLSGGKSRERSRERKASTPSLPKESSNETAKVRDGTLSTKPAQEEVSEKPAGEPEKPKGFDIFADSPPRSNTAVAAPAESDAKKSTTSVSVPAAPVISQAVLKAIEIQSRIGALLEDDDDDLQLTTLLAERAKLVRRTNEYKERKESKRVLQSNSSDEKSRAGDGRQHSHQSRPSNPFKRQSVLSESRRQRNGSHSSAEENWDDDLQPAPSQYKGSHFQPACHIKVEGDAKLPSHAQRDIVFRNGVAAANAPPPPMAKAPPATIAQESPDTDDYIDNWENDDSMASIPKNAPLATPTPAGNGSALLSSTPLPPPAFQLNGADDDNSNTLWNANSTPPPRAKQSAMPANNIHAIYDSFLSSIKMSNTDRRAENGESSSGSERRSSTSSSSSSSSGSSSDSQEHPSSDDNEDSNSSNKATKFRPPDKEKPQQQMMNDVSRDLEKLNNLEGNLDRIQIMRETFDGADEMSEDLLKMESLLLSQRNAIMDKYRKQELKGSAAAAEHQQPGPESLQTLSGQPPTGVHSSVTAINNIFDANREAIKLKLSTLKLTRKSAILDKDDGEQLPPSKLAQEPPKKPPKEIAIVKPTIVEPRPKQRSPSRNRRVFRSRSRSQSYSRNRSRNRSPRPSRGKEGSRSPSPRRRRQPSHKRSYRLDKRTGSVISGRSNSRSSSRSRTRSRSPRRRRGSVVAGHRRRGSISPGLKTSRPRSPPPSRLRRSPSRERDRDRDRDRERDQHRDQDRDRDRDRGRFLNSRSPLPFRPPSPPIRRSWSTSQSRSPTRRCSGSRSRSGTPRQRSSSSFAGREGYPGYFEENQGMEAAAYYYNMSLMQQENQDPSAGMYDTYAAYMDSAYNMEQAYAQYSDGYGLYGDYSMGGAAAPPVTSSLLRELPKAPVPAGPVAVQKGNVLEIVPSGDATMQQLEPQVPVKVEEPEDRKPNRKRVNFVDNVDPNYGSDGEDRAVVAKAVDRALRQFHERQSRTAVKLQQTREELLALPPPPPPATPAPPDVHKAVVLRKTPKFRFFLFDPEKGAIVKSHTRALRPTGRPPFDPKQFAMLMQSGRLPPLPPGYLRHRPPPIPPHVDPATRAAMMRDFFARHPPPPLPMPVNMPVPSNGMPYYLNGPPPMAAIKMEKPPMQPMPPMPAPTEPQPIPVLGYHGYTQPHAFVPSQYPAPAPVPAPLPVPMPLVVNAVPSPVPGPVRMPMPRTKPHAAAPPLATARPFFTPPPLTAQPTLPPLPALPTLPPLPALPELPSLPTKFNVKSVPSIREIMPADILLKIGPLPKTLDLDGGDTPVSTDDGSEDRKPEEAAKPITKQEVKTEPMEKASIK